MPQNSQCWVERHAGNLRARFTASNVITIWRGLKRLLKKRERGSAGQVGSKSEGKGWHLTMAERCCWGGQA
jgi:hypothetical protein